MAWEPEQQQGLMRIFVGESERWHGQPLAEALLEWLRQRHIAGATLLKGAAGYGVQRQLHTQHLLRYAADLPVIVEVVDDMSVLEALIPMLDKHLQGGVLTLEKVRVVHFGRHK